MSSIRETLGLLIQARDEAYKIFLDKRLADSDRLAMAKKVEQYNAQIFHLKGFMRASGADPREDEHVPEVEKYHNYGQLLEGDVFAFAGTGEHVTDGGGLVVSAVYIKKRTCCVCVLDGNLGQIGCALTEVDKKAPVILLNLSVLPASYCELRMSDGSWRVAEPEGD